MKLARTDTVPQSEMTLRVLTYNLWHGGWLRGRREAAAAKRERHAQQLAQIRALDPDVVLLQEISPVPELTSWMADELGMQAVWAIDNGGLHVALPARPGRERRRVGLPGDFLNGLAILARPQLQLAPMGRVRLSGPTPLHSSRFAAQLGETRFALGATLQVPRWHRLLIVNAHLHAARRANALTAAPLPGSARRLREVLRCLRAMNRWSSDAARTESPIGGTLLAGDLNDVPDSSAIRHLLDSGLVDSLASGHPLDGVVTWCPQVNDRLLSACVTRPDSLLARALARRRDRRPGVVAPPPRRIDYILTCPVLAPTVTRAEPFIQHGSTAQPLSDHTGWVVEFSAP